MGKPNAFSPIHFLVPVVVVIGLVWVVIADSRPTCPNLLVQKGPKLYLYDTRSPDKKPIIFDSRQEYLRFVEWQTKSGIKCPVLYAQHGYNAQRQPTYTIRPSVSDPQAGLSAHVYTPIKSLSLS
jgi:hypothetical protein